MLWATAVKIGLPVFPCNAKKRPACANGFKDAETDAERIKDLFLAHPRATLIGVATGAVSGIDALDLDTTRHDTAIAFLHTISPVRTRTHQTQSGGFHFLFNHAAGRNNTAGTKHRKGVDVRGDGGYIIWWPAHGYAVNPLPVEDWPHSLLARFEKRRPTKRGEFNPEQITDEAIGQLIREVACAPEGRRNTTLFVSACRIGDLIRARKLDRRYGESLLIGAARACALDQISAERTIASALDRTV